MCLPRQALIGQASFRDRPQHAPHSWPHKLTAPRKLWAQPRHCQPGHCSRSGHKCGHQLRSHDCERQGHLKLRREGRGTAWSLTSGQVGLAHHSTARSAALSSRPCQLEPQQSMHAKQRVQAQARLRPLRPMRVSQRARGSDSGSWRRPAAQPRSAPACTARRRPPRQRPAPADASRRRHLAGAPGATGRTARRRSPATAGVGPGMGRVGARSPAGALGLHASIARQARRAVELAGTGVGQARQQARPSTLSAKPAWLPVTRGRPPWPGVPLTWPARPWYTATARVRPQTRRE